MVQSYLVTSVGLSAQDEGALQRLLELSRVRDRYYAYLGENAFAADVIVVNADQHDAIELVQDSIFVATGGVRSAARKQAIVYAARNPQARDEYEAWQLPLGGERFLDLLDARMDGATAQVAREIARHSGDGRRVNRLQAIDALLDDLADPDDLLEIGLSLEDLAAARVIARTLA